MRCDLATDDQMDSSVSTENFECISIDDSIDNRDVEQDRPNIVSLEDPITVTDLNMDTFMFYGIPVPPV